MITQHPCGCACIPLTLNGSRARVREATAAGHSGVTTGASRARRRRVGAPDRVVTRAERAASPTT